MLLYFDESYCKEYLILGLLFNPHSKFVHKQLLKTKKKNNFITNEGDYKELKYNQCINNKTLIVAKEAIDIFIKSTSWYRSVVIDLREFDFNYFGRVDESIKIKKARAYKKFAEMLIDKNTKNLKDSVLLCDSLERCKGDYFIEILKQKYCKLPLKTFKDIKEIKSYRVETQVNQINDLITGCILNELTNPTNKFKREIKIYLLKSLEIINFKPAHWKNFSKRTLDEHFPKFQIWFWDKYKSKKDSGKKKVLAMVNS